MQFLQNGHGQANEKLALIGPGDKFADYDSGLGAETDLRSVVTRSSPDNELLSSVLSAHNINYTVKVSTSCCRRKEAKQILHNITGVFRKGMNAILGPTGSGKSTLLDVLADRKDPRGVEGQLLLDGKPVPDNFKCMVGYVVQGDILMGTLTVRENLAFSAALRLPTTISHAEKESLVNKVIKELGLQDCADTKIGTPLIRGVSGGERKRCSIGMELIISPSILLLDEPTTGLDANTAYSVLLALKRMAEGGRTVIFSIHQPRYSIYRMFDTIMLLSGGRTVFSGLAEEAVHFFAEQGFECQVHNNPSDFFLDIICGISARSGVTSDFKGISRTSDEMVKHFKGSIWNNRLEAEADAILSKCQGKQFGDRHPAVEYATSWSHQTLVVSKVTALNMIRNPEAASLMLGKSALSSVIFSIVFWQLSENPSTALSDRFGAMYYICVHLVFFNLGALSLFIKERKMFLHESISGYYRVSAYFLAKVFCECLPIRLIATVVTCTIAYLCMGFRDGFDYYCLFALCMFAMTMAAASLALLVGSWSTDNSTGHVTITMCFTLSSLFAGFFVNINSVLFLIRWIQYLSIFRYAAKAFSVNEFKDRVFCEGNMTCAQGNTFLQENDIAYETAWDFWSNYAFIFGFTVLALILTYIRLRCMNKYT